MRRPLVRHGGTVQVDPMKPKLKPPGTEHLKLKCEILLSTCAFKFNSRRYNMVDELTGDIGIEFLGPEHRLLSYKPTACQIILPMPGKGLHSSTFQLNLSRF